MHACTDGGHLRAAEAIARWRSRGRWALLLSILAALLAGRAMAAPAVRLAISAPPAMTAGLTQSFTVEAVDAGGITDREFRGEIALYSSDLQALLPPVYTFTGAESGLKSFLVTFVTPGMQTLAVTSRAPAPIAGATVAVAVATPPPELFSVIPTQLEFGTQIVNVASPSQAVSVRSASAAPLANTLEVSAGYVLTHDCGLLSAGSACTARVSLRPSAAGLADGALTISNQAGSRTVLLKGRGEASLVTHYYRSILKRDPDAGGKVYWDGEAQRMQRLGANVNETWFAMAGSFYASAEYRALARTDTQFVEDLYLTFFDRAPDAGGLSFWAGLIGQGMPREVVLAGFMFSPEFGNFARAIFGNAAVAAEIDMVVDFYRGLLARLPDDGGFAYWRDRFRTAKCAGAFSADAVGREAESVSSLFANSQEFAGRARSNAQFVGDLYNAFLRRGGDLGGVRFWIGQLETGAMTREAVRQQFVASPEFRGRVQGIVGKGCELFVSASLTQVKPFHEYSLRLSPAIPGATYKFSYDLGGGYVVPVEGESSADGSVAVPAPPGVMDASGGFVGGIYRVTAMQTLNGVTTVSSPLEVRVLDLPVSTYPLGNPTRTLLEAARLMTLHSLENLTFLSAASQNRLDASVSKSAGKELYDVLGQLATDLGAAQSGTLLLGTLNGTAIIMDAKSVAMLDRLSMGIIEAWYAATYPSAAGEKGLSSLFEDRTAVARMLADSARQACTRIGKVVGVVAGVATVAALVAGAPSIALAAGTVGAIGFMVTTLTGTGMSVALDGGSTALWKGKAEMSDFAESGKFFANKYWDLATDNLAKYLLEPVFGKVWTNVITTAKKAQGLYESFAGEKVRPAYDAGILPAVPPSPICICRSEILGVDRPDGCGGATGPDGLPNDVCR